MINVSDVQAVIDTANTLHSVGQQWHNVTVVAEVSRLESDGNVSRWRAVITVKFTGETYASAHNGVTLMNAYAYLLDCTHVARLAGVEHIGGELGTSLMARGTFTIDIDGLVHFHL